MSIIEKKTLINLFPGINNNHYLRNQRNNLDSSNLKHPIIGNKKHSPGFYFFITYVLIISVSVIIAQSEDFRNPLKISAVRIDANSDFVPDRLGEKVTVSGRANVASGILDTLALKVSIQDKEAGILLVSPIISDPIYNGDSVVATGIISQWNGETQLQVSEYRVIPSEPIIPEAIELTPEHKQIEQYEGMLLRMEGRFFDRGRSLTGDQFLKIKLAGENEVLVTVFIYHRHFPNITFDSFTTGDLIAVTGVLGQYDQSEPYNEFYELYPRYPDDVKEYWISITVIRNIFLPLLIGFLAVLLWVFTLQAQVHRSIKELRHRDKKIQQQNDFLTNIIEAITHPFFVVDVNSLEVVLSNSAAKSLTKLQVSSCHALTHRKDNPCDDSANPCPLEIILKSKKPVIVEHVHYDSNGLPQIVEVHGYPIFDDQGNVTQMIEYSMNITERKQAEKLIHAWQERYEMIIGATGQIIYDWNLESDITEWSGSIETVSGYTKDEFSKMKDAWRSCIHPNDLDRIVKKIEGAIDNGAASIEVTYRFKRKDGVYLCILDRGFIIHDANGKAVKSLGSMTDITGQKQAEAKADRAYKLQTVLYQIADAAGKVRDLAEFYHSVHQYLGTVIDVTNFFIAIYDKEKEMMTFPYYQDEKDQDASPVKLRKTQSAYVIRLGTPLLSTRANTERLVDQGEIDIVGTISEIWLGCPLTVKGEIIGVIVVQSYSDPNLYSEQDIDILSFVSDQVASAIQRINSQETLKKSEQEYRHLSEQLTTTNQMKDLLMDIISHDLKNPAGVVSGMADIMLMDNPEEEALQLIKDGSDNLLKVIENASILSKIAIGEKIEKQTLNLNAMVQSSAVEFSTLLKEAVMTLENRIDESVQIYANPIIEQVFKNYISNAIKYSPNGKKIVIYSDRKDSFIEVAVIDFGRTVPEEDRERIFQRFTQLKGAKRGRGLGLAIVKRIAEAHGGDAWVTANSPRGNIFLLSIPVEKNRE